jgi:N-acetylmuramoyl-L-alanine amidase
VRTFQDRRGLRVDGVCGEHTWSALVEAGWRLGDRPLYLMSPMQRGDDVAELQRRLGCLGFDAGRVDGIFGPNTDRALQDFQRNGGLVADAICGPATLAALARLGSSSDRPGPSSSVASIRERERHRHRPQTLTGRTIAVGESGGLDALATAVAGTLTVAGARAVLLQHPDPSEQAAQANALDVDAFVGLVLARTAVGESIAAPTGCIAAYYCSPTGGESPEGRRLAELVQAGVATVLDAPTELRGMAVPVLRETRMPAVLVELGAPAVVVQRSAELAAAVTDALRHWVVAAAADA